MRALVTGHLGFVGRHMHAALDALGYEVTGIDLKDQGGGSRDLRVVLPKHTGTRFDLVVHCAAVVGGRQTIDGEPLRLLAEDLAIDAALFRWALQARPGRIVYYSSSAAYPVELQGHVMPQRLRECDIRLDCPALPDATYGWVKLTGERMAAEANMAGIPTHVLRPFSGYGTDQDDVYPFPAIIGRARRGENPLVIWSNGVRDWVHIDDVVGATLAVVEQDVLEPVNICTGVATSFAALADVASREAGYGDAWVTVLDDMPTGVHHRVGDPTMMHKFYTPHISIEEGVRRAFDGT